MLKLNMYRALVKSLLASAVILGGIAPAFGGTVTICHGTSSVKNPWEVITIDAVAWDKGHSKHSTDPADHLYENGLCDGVVTLPPEPPATGTGSSAKIVAAVESAPGLNCWDINLNGVKDLDYEDSNHDLIVDVKDCRYDHDTLQQNPGALYDQEKMCKTLHLFGQAAVSAGATTMDAADLADTLKDLGCHSSPVSAQSGTTHRISFEYIRDGVYPLFSYEPSTFTTIPGFALVIHKAYITKTLETGIDNSYELQADCKLACDGDPECAAAIHFVTFPPDKAMCHLFHHSDRMTTDWSEWCGFEIDDTGTGLGSCEKSNHLIYIKD